ncbi:DUF6701 domain-containing protein [Photobacterium profundum]|uniref:MshQ n=1 Tax=Photobacterium profundum 3TCK TaxID=314280 RepID=Q1Z1R8_9GAMM|nr:DUF6701 domain-containing protein [Photobacterium profundum]EAS42437.1 MshQ [Photobacterium profundum 3TCK]
MNNIFPRFKFFPCVFIVLLQLLSFSSFAKNYDLDNTSKYPPCSQGNWSKNGAMLTCNGKMELKENDKIRSNTAYTLVANAGMKLDENIIGQVGSNIDLRTNHDGLDIKDAVVYGDIYSTSGKLTAEKIEVRGIIDVGGDIDIKGGDNVITQSITSRNGKIKLKDTDVSGPVLASGEINIDDSDIGGSVISDNNKITLHGSTIESSVTASGEVHIGKSNVGGSVTSINNKVKLHDSTIESSITASNEIDIDDSDVGGSVKSEHNKVKLKESAIEGNVTASNEITIENSDVVGNIKSVNNKVTLKKSSYIDGNIDAASHQVVKFDDYDHHPSTVTGYCRPISDPENACNSELVKPVLSWQMDEDAWQSGNNSVKDSSGNELHGTANNGANTITDKISRALTNDDLGFGTCNYGTFNGQNQFAEIAHNNKLSFDDNFTISAWVKPTQYPDSDLKTIISKDGNYEFHINSEGFIYWWWEQQGNSSQHSLLSTKAIPLNEWTHISIRYKKATGSDKTSQWIFINGELDATSEVKHKVQTNNLPFQVGQDQGIASRFFNGSIDEVRVFNTALTDRQISELAEERHFCDDVVNEPGFRYGRVSFTTTKIEFEQAFPTDSEPLVFLSPSINALTPDQDGPATLRLVSVTNTGFTVEKVEPHAPAANYTPSQKMQSVDYVAVLEGETTLSNGHKIYASKIKLREDNDVRELQGSKNGNPSNADRGWKNISFPAQQFSGKPTLMLEIQSQNNSRWLTAAGNQLTQNGFKVALEQSEVRGGNANNTETVAYMASMPSVGDFDLFGKRVFYDFQHARSGISGGTQNFLTRCNETTDFKYTGFTAPPVMVIGKLSRSGNNGGWIRRCHRDNTRMSIVMDEDQDSDKERSHVVEDVSYMAFSVESDTTVPEFQFGAYPTSALTCTPINITVNVVDKESGNPITDYEGQIGLATSTGKGDWQLFNGNGQFIPGNTDSGNASYQYHIADSGSATFTLSYFHTGIMQIMLKSPSGEILKETDDITFKAEGLKLERTSDYPYGRKSAIANKPLGYKLSAVTEDPSAQGQCNPIESFDGEKEVAFNFTYVTTAARKVPPYIDSSPLNMATDTPLKMAFVKGVSNFDFKYVEAGAIQLIIKHSDGVALPPEEPGKNWLSREIINVSPWLVAADVEGNLSGVATDSDKGFKAAGDEFTVNYKAVIWDKNIANTIGLPKSDPSGLAVTENFNSSYAADVIPVDTTPSSGNVGDLSFPSTLSYVLGKSVEAIPATYGEVGSTKLGGTGAKNYLITGNDIPFYTYKNIGRFYPKYFLVSGAKHTDNCSAFNYLGNSNSLINYTLTAKSTGGDTTENYDSKLGYKALAIDSNFDLNGEDSNDGVSLKDQIKRSSSAFSWSKGQVQASWYYKLVKNTTPQSPFNQFVLSLEGEGPDSVPLKPLNEQPDDNFGGAYTSKLASALIFRWGRVRLTDAFGPEVSPITAPVYIEYYDKSQAFVVNVEDQCTTLTLSDFSFIEGNDSSKIPVGGGTTAATFSDTDKGEGEFTFTAPGAGHQGIVTPTLDLYSAGYPWLRVDKTGNGQLDNIEQAQIQFGLYRGSDRIIWWREKLD